MAEKTVNAILQIKSDTAANWTANNPVLKNRELAYDSTNKKFKIGDGVTAWSSLSYLNATPSELNQKLDKLSYEWNKALNFGSSGKLYVGRFKMYDSNITIEFSCTTNTTYSGKLVIATQNGIIYKVDVYGDASNSLASRIFVKGEGVGAETANQQWIQVYFNPAGYSKNICHIKAQAIVSYDSSVLMTSVSSIPTDYTNTANNQLTSNFLGKTAKASDSDKLDGQDGSYYLDYNNFTNKPTIPDVSSFITKDVNNLTNYELKTETGTDIALSINTSTYVMTLQLKNSAGTVISTGTVDLPLETMVVNAEYVSSTKKIKLTLQNGTTTEFSVSDLVSGLVPNTRTVNGKALSSNITLSASDVGLGNVGNFKAVSTVASQGLTDTEKSNARANIGAGTSSFSGSYNDLTNKPTIPAAYTLPVASSSTLGGIKTGGEIDDLTALPIWVDNNGVAYADFENGATRLLDLKTKTANIEAVDTTEGSKSTTFNGRIKISSEICCSNDENYSIGFNEEIVPTLNNNMGRFLSISTQGINEDYMYYQFPDYDGNVPVVQGQGTNGQVLTSNGDGTYDWQNQSIIDLGTLTSDPNTTTNTTLNALTTTGLYRFVYNGYTYIMQVTISGSYIYQFFYSNPTIIYRRAYIDSNWSVLSFALSNYNNYTSASNTSSKIYLIGATSQGTGKYTYSHDTVYVNTDGHLYDSGNRVLTTADSVGGSGGDCLITDLGTITTSIISTTNTQLNAVTESGLYKFVYSSNTYFMTVSQLNANSIYQYIFLGATVYRRYTTNASTWYANSYLLSNYNLQAASSNTSSKIFLIGRTSQSSSGGTTYSHDTVYIGTDGHLYDTDYQVLTSDSNNYTKRTQTYTDVSSINCSFPASKNVCKLKIIANAPVAIQNGDGNTLCTRSSAPYAIYLDIYTIKATDGTLSFMADVYMPTTNDSFDYNTFTTYRKQFDLGAFAYLIITAMTSTISTLTVETIYR